MKKTFLALGLCLLAYVVLSAQSVPQPPSTLATTLDWNDPTHVDGAVCGMQATTNAALPLCQSGQPPCENKDGSFTVTTGQQVQFGIWSVSANKCQIVSSSGVLGRHAVSVRPKR